MFIASGLGPFSGPAAHLQHAAPGGIAHAEDRYRRDAELHYQVLNDPFKGREYIVGNEYTIADTSAWGWIDRAQRVLKRDDDLHAAFPELKRWSAQIEARPAVERARAINKVYAFKIGRLWREFCARSRGEHGRRRLEPLHAFGAKRALNDANLNARSVAALAIAWFASSILCRRAMPSSRSLTRSSSRR
jgi:hypothetical protein